MKMKIILIGYKGFIGSNLHAFFNEKGLDVTVYSSTEIKEDRNDKLNSLVDFSSLLSQFEKSVVINCSGNGNVPTSIINPYFDFNANVSFAQFLLETIRKANSNCTYIHLSSAAVYGNPRVLPIKEDSDLHPISPYGYHKVLSENLCKQYAELYGIQSIVLRPFSVYGPGLRKQLIWDVHEKFYLSNKKDPIEFFGTGNETRDFIYIEDLCQSIELLLKQLSSLSNFEVFNIANEEEVKIKTIIELIASKFEDKQFDFSGISREGDPNNWKGDNSKLKHLGYARKFSFEQGLAAFTNWYLNSRIDR
jgi:dTDP-glucose 4,6-dehydratase/UDP-glucose 4-epimerase